MKENFYLKGFTTFFKIGFFTFGGGYAMIPFIQSEVVEKNKWVKEEEFFDIIAVAQSCPGVLAINLSVYIGYHVKGVRGALCTCLGVALPAFLAILILAIFFAEFKENKIVAAIFRGLRPTVVALIAAPIFMLAKEAKIRLSNCWIPIVCALAIWLLGVSPIVIIILSGVCGYLYGRFLKSTE